MVENDAIFHSETKEIGERIKAARKNNGWTQKELAQKTNLSQQTISFIENGCTNITMKTFKKIADALNLRISVETRCEDSSSIQTYTSEA